MPYFNHDCTHAQLVLHNMWLLMTSLRFNNIIDFTLADGGTASYMEGSCE